MVFSKNAITSAIYAFSRFHQLPSASVPYCLLARDATGRHARFPMKPSMGGDYLLRGALGYFRKGEIASAIYAFSLPAASASFRILPPARRRCDMPPHAFPAKPSMWVLFIEARVGYFRKNSIASSIYSFFALPSDPARLRSLP